MSYRYMQRLARGCAATAAIVVACPHAVAGGVTGDPPFAVVDVDADGATIEDGDSVSFGDIAYGAGMSVRQLLVTTTAPMSPDAVTFTLVGEDADHFALEWTLPESTTPLPMFAVSVKLDRSMWDGELNAALEITDSSEKRNQRARTNGRGAAGPFTVQLRGAVFRNWDDVPDSYGQQSAKDAVGELLDNATTSTQRIALFGDSQETSPGGAGAGYIPRLNYELITTFTNGRTGESRFMYPGVYAGSQPPAAWLMSGRRAHVSNSTLLSDEQILPQFRVKSATDHHGVSIVLRHDADRVRPDAFEDLNLPVDADFIGHDQPLQLDVFCVSYPGSPALRWNYAPIADGDSVWQAPALTSGTVAGLDGPLGIVGVSTEVVTNPDPSLHPLNHVLLQSVDPDDDVHICGMRWRRVDDPGGIAVTTISEGGYRSFSFLQNHSESAAMLRVAGPWNAVMYQLGANDTGSGVEPSVFRQNTLDLITALRGPAWLDDPDLLVLLVSEYPGGGRTANERRIHDMQAGVLASICDIDDRCLLLNARRFVEDAGWNHDTAYQYLPDGSHPNALGVRTMAWAVTDALLDAAKRKLPGDIDRSGVVDHHDLLAVLGALAGDGCAPPCQADTNNDGAVDMHDVLRVLRHWN